LVAEAAVKRRELVKAGEKASCQEALDDVKGQQQGGTPADIGSLQPPRCFALLLPPTPSALNLMGFSPIPIGIEEGNFVDLEELMPGYMEGCSEDAIISWLIDGHAPRESLVQHLEENAPWHLPRVFLHHSNLGAPLQYNRGDGSKGLLDRLQKRRAAGKKLGLVRQSENRGKDLADSTIQDVLRNRLAFPIKLRRVPGCPRKNIPSTIPPPPTFSPQHVYSPFPNISAV
jgi:hypothetical protein